MSRAAWPGIEDSNNSPHASDTKYECNFVAFSTLFATPCVGNIILYQWFKMFFVCELSSSVSVPVDGPCLLPPSCLTISRILYIFVSSLLSFFICIPAIIFRINILSIDDITMMKGDGIREGPELFLESSKDSLNVLSESIVLCHKNIVKSCCFVSL